MVGAVAKLRAKLPRGLVGAVAKLREANPWRIVDAVAWLGATSPPLIADAAARLRLPRWAEPRTRWQRVVQRRRRARVRRATRVVSWMALVGGVLLLAEVTVTLVWQEPFTALRARAEQSALRGELANVEARARRPSQESPLAALAHREAADTATGHALGRIRIPAIGVSFVFVEGTDEGSLEKGPGRYIGTAMPGEAGTVGIAGHRTTYLAPFNRIEDLGAGDHVVLTMPYAKFTYRVFRERVVDPSDVSVLAAAPRPRLVLTSCHPEYSDAQRYVVEAVLVGVRGRHGSASARS